MLFPLSDKSLKHHTVQGPGPESSPQEKELHPRIQKSCKKCNPLHVQFHLRSCLSNCADYELLKHTSYSNTLVTSKNLSCLRWIHDRKIKKYCYHSLTLFFTIINIFSEECDDFFWQMIHHRRDTDSRGNVISSDILDDDGVSELDDVSSVDVNARDIELIEKANSFDFFGRRLNHFTFPPLSLWRK